MSSRMLLTLGTVLVFAVATLPLYAQTSPVTVATIRASVQNYPEQMRSMSCKIKTTTTIGDAFFQANNITADNLPHTQIQQDEWAFQGGKVINESKYIEGDPSPAGHNMATVNLFDGSTSYHIQSENGTPTSRSTYASREHQPEAQVAWSPLQFGYRLDNHWLSDALSSDNPTLERAGMDPTFGPLYLVHLNIGKREERIWFAPKYGNIAVKVVEDSPHGRAIYAGVQYERIGSLWLPLRGDFQLLTKQPDGRTIVQMKKNFIFSGIQINTVSDAAFEFHWPTGAALYDNDTRTRYYRDASGNWVKRMDVAEAISHIPSRVSAADFAPWVFLVSLAALFTLGYLRWRRRASA